MEATVATRTVSPYPRHYLLLSTFLTPHAWAYAIFPSFPQRLSEALLDPSKSVVPLISLPPPLSWDRSLFSILHRSGVEVGV